MGPGWNPGLGRGRGSGQGGGRETHRVRLWVRAARRVRDSGAQMDAEAYLHIVMDAYHGDVVSLSARLEVGGGSGGGSSAGGSAGGVAGGGAQRGGGSGHSGSGHSGSGDSGSGDRGSGGGGSGGGTAGGADRKSAPIVTVTVRASQPLPARPESRTWHLRFVANGVTIDAREADGTLVDLVWEEHGFTARLRQPAGTVAPDVQEVLKGANVAHVVVVPEGRPA